MENTSQGGEDNDKTQGKGGDDKDKDKPQGPLLDKKQSSDTFLKKFWGSGNKEGKSYLTDWMELRRRAKAEEVIADALTVDDTKEWAEKMQKDLDGFVAQYKEDLDNILAAEDAKTNSMEEDKKSKKRDKVSDDFDDLDDL